MKKHQLIQVKVIGATNLLKKEERIIWAEFFDIFRKKELKKNPLKTKRSQREIIK